MFAAGAKTAAVRQAVPSQTNSEVARHPESLERVLRAAAGAAHISNSEMQLICFGFKKKKKKNCSYQKAFSCLCLEISADSLSVRILYR